MSQKVRRRSDLAKQREARPTGRGNGGENGNPEASLPLLRNSEKSTFDKCRWLWSQSYGRGLAPRTSAPALRFGTLVHKALAAWYIPGVKRGVHPAVTFEREYEIELAEQQTQFGFRDENGTWQDAAELGVAMLNHYVGVYGRDPQWEVLATEQPFRVLVHDNDGDPWFWYTGILDGIWRDRGTKDIWIADHKTTAGIGSNTGIHLRMDDQAGGYWTFGVEWLLQQGILKPQQRLSGMLYNFLRKAMPDDRPKDQQGRSLNKDGSISQKQPSPYFLRQPIYRDAHDREQARERFKEMVREREAIVDGTLKPRKSPGQFNCPGCWLFDACEMHETGGDWQTVLAAISQPWNPFEEHEIRAGEQK